MNSDKYIGNELELFEKAINWKSYYRTIFKPYLKGEVLEVGAGVGGTTKALCDGTQKEWVCLEPDNQLSSKIENLIKEASLPSCCSLVKGTLQNISSSKLFDAILYIDVIEHIKDDAEEMKLAEQHLKPGGVLIVLVPAHQWLFSPFDASIGHYRRYNKSLLNNAVHKTHNLKKEKVKYLDSVGLMASLGNKLFLKQDYPTEKQIKFWDTVLVRMSYIGDFITNYRLGKTLIGIWRKSS